MRNDIYTVIIKNLNNEKINYTFLLRAKDYKDAFLKLSKQVYDTIQWQDNNKQARKQKELDEKNARKRGEYENI